MKYTIGISKPQELNMSLNKNLNQRIDWPLTFRGRTGVLGMWLWGIVALILAIIIFCLAYGGREPRLYTSLIDLLDEMERPALLGLLIIPIWMLWTAAVRRLHDHGLSGNWLFFLSPVGIALMYMAHVLDLDRSVDPVVERINRTGGGIFGWLYAAAAWFFVSGIVLFCLLFLCEGKSEDNMFGPSPYPPEPPAEGDKKNDPENKVFSPSSVSPAAGEDAKAVSGYKPDDAKLEMETVSGVFEDFCFQMQDNPKEAYRLYAVGGETAYELYKALNKKMPSGIKIKRITFKGTKAKPEATVEYSSDQGRGFAYFSFVDDVWKVSSF